MKIRSVVTLSLFCFVVWPGLLLASPADPKVDSVVAGFMNPPTDCRPHTRWWWMGNALQKEDITWQLDQMNAEHIGGVEQVTMNTVYEKGNHEYLSPEYFELLRHSVEQARDRGMEYSLNFGGPGWIWGGKWVPREDQSKVLIASMLELEGPQTYSGPLSAKATPNVDDLPRSTPIIAPEDRLVKVVAARVENGRLVAESLLDLSATMNGKDITWNVPGGKWQLMAFWITQRDNSDAVDHLNKGAMERYCEALGSKYANAIGEHFGKTVDSFFSDSFEVPIFRNGLYWTDGLFEAFQQEEGYDLTPWLPALWWEVEDLSPKVRYDVNHFLHRQSMHAFFDTFTNWCKQHNVRARIQPYGFVTDVLEGAGAADLPEMEITPGEKDAVPWFDTRIGPREYVASGAHLYGRNIVTTEAHTFLHHEPYRETLQELKISTDGFLRAGANKIYNHGFIASPEHDIVPTRGFYEAIRISPENIWWPYYHCVADYTARCCWLLRQGDFVADVAVYSPLANQWTQSVLNARRWTRDFEWGGLSRLLSTSGYAFDLVNDDMLQNHARFEGNILHAGAMSYRVLILPDIGALPLATYRQIEAFVRQGGSVIALERKPDSSTGMKNHAANDEEVGRMSSELFDSPRGPDDNALRLYGQGRTYFLETVLHRDEPLDYRSVAFDPFLKTLRQCAPPDMDTDPVRVGKRTNDGLVFLHRHSEPVDIYFVTNLQDSSVNQDVRFHVGAGEPQCWDPQTGKRRPLCSYARDGEYTSIPLTLAPYESCFICFDRSTGSGETPRVAESDFEEILTAEGNGFVALAQRNGIHHYQIANGESAQAGSVVVEGIPAVYSVGGPWTVQFDGKEAPEAKFEWPTLASWTDIPEIRHFSGRGLYTVTFDLSACYCADDIDLQLSLGTVGTVADIRLNGQAVGAHWMTGQNFAITGLVKAGRNELQIAVTNTLINRVSGLKDFPDVPEDLQHLYGNRRNPVVGRAATLIGFEPLPPSGLLGPVEITARKRVLLSLPEVSSATR